MDLFDGYAVYLRFRLSKALEDAVRHGLDVGFQCASVDDRQYLGEVPFMGGIRDYNIDFGAGYAMFSHFIDIDPDIQAQPV
jgi:hypothetical protein